MRSAAPALQPRVILPRAVFTRKLTRGAVSFRAAGEEFSDSTAENLPPPRAGEGWGGGRMAPRRLPYNCALQLRFSITALCGERIRNTQQICACRCVLRALC